MKGEEKRFCIRVCDETGAHKISADAVLGLAEWRTRHGIPRKGKIGTQLDIPHLHEMVDVAQQTVSATEKS